MKKIKLVILLIYILGNTCSFGQDTKSSSLLLFMEMTKIFIPQFEKDNSTIAKLEIDAVSDKVNNSLPVRLIGNTSYKVFLMGEFGKVDIINLAIKLYSGGTWTTVKEVKGEANSIGTDFTPASTGSYEFEITASKFASGYTAGRYCLIISY